MLGIGYNVQRKGAKVRAKHITPSLASPASPASREGLLARQVGKKLRHRVSRARESSLAPAGPGAAQGIDAIPHLEMWKDLPFLVRDGVIFAVDTIKSKGRPGYDGL